MLLVFQAPARLGQPTRRFSFILRPCRVLPGIPQVFRATHFHVANVKNLLNQRAVTQPASRPSVKFAIELVRLGHQLPILMPLTTCASAVINDEGTKQPAILVPLPVRAVPLSVIVVRFLGNLAIVMAGAAKSMQPPVQFPVFQAKLAVAIITPIYATFWHVKKSTICFADEHSH